MEPILRKFRSHAEADAADRAYYQSLTPNERLRILCELNSRFFGTAKGIEKVCRIIKRPQPQAT